LAARHKNREIGKTLVRRRRHPGTATPDPLLSRENLGFDFPTSGTDVEITHEQRYPGKADQGVDPASYSGSKNLLDRIHLSKTDDAPIERSDDRNSADDFT
jgi:hypothetical protein